MISARRRALVVEAKRISSKTCANAKSHEEETGARARRVDAIGFYKPRLLAVRCTLTSPSRSAC